MIRRRRGRLCHAWSAGGTWLSRRLRLPRPPSDSLRLARRAYVVLACGASMPLALRLLCAAEPDGALRAALQARLVWLRRRSAPLPPWSARQPRHAPAALRTLDALLVGRASREQALAEWRIEMLSAGLADLPEQALGSESAPVGAVARRSNDQ